VGIRTIFLMAEECARGERQGWQEFVRDHTFITRRLFERYFPTLVPELDRHVVQLYLRARAQDNAWFQSFHFANEREFLMHFRELVFTYGREEARVPVPELTLTQVEEIMKGMPVVEREMLWLFIRGYSAEQMAPMIMNAAATAEAVKKVADQRLGEILPGSSPEAFNVSARVLMEAAEKTRGENCLPVKTFNNLVNGQITWRERELAEEHIRDCFYCLDRFASFQEMVRYRKDAVPLDEAQTETILAELNLPPAKTKGVLARLLSRA
jgi:hypothetical protein